MAKISTTRPTSVKIAEQNEETPENSPAPAEVPSAHIISNILNYSKALSVERTKKGVVIANVMN